MPAGRFIIEGQRLAAGTEVTLPDQVAHQARDVLRLGVGDMLTLLDGVGGVYRAELVMVERKRVAARLGARSEGQAEPRVRVVLCLGMLKAAKFETVLQKCTELGVAAFVPLLTERAVAVAEATGEAKRRRWLKIAAEAVEQCGGARLPEISEPKPLMHALADLPSDGVAMMPWEEAAAGAMTIRNALHRRGETPSEVRLFVGPEGGFSAGEVALARRNGAVPVTLGPRILRAETAAIVATTLALEALSALDGSPIREDE